MSRYVDLPSGTVNVYDYGGSGPLILLVHGLGGSVANWDAVAPALTNHGHVIAIDLPGFGLSPPGRDWSLETHETAIIELLDYLETPSLLVGNSMGALLTQMVAAHRPELVIGLLLVSPATPPRLPDPAIDWPMARRLLLNSTPVVGPAISRRLFARLTPRELVEEALKRITHKPGRIPLDMVQAFVAMAERRAKLPWAPEAIPKSGQAIRSLFLRKPEFVEMIREIRAPTLVVQGVADPIVSPNSVRWLCSLRPDWQLVHLEDTGHTPQIDAPVRFLSAIEPWVERLLHGDTAAAHAG